MVHVSNVMCLMLGVGIGADGIQYQVSPESLERLGISEDVELIMSEFVEILSTLEEEMHELREH